jgi:hypothetical protein
MLLCYKNKRKFHFTRRETDWPVLDLIPCEPYLAKPCAFLPKRVEIWTYPIGTWVLSQISQTGIELGLKRFWLLPIPLINDIGTTLGEITAERPTYPHEYTKIAKWAMKIA